MRGFLRVGVRLALIAGVVMTAFAWAAVSDAAAGSDIYEYTNYPTTTEAGGHPDVITSLEITNRYHTEGEMPFCRCHDPKNIMVHTPAGVIANPHVVSECTSAQVALFECSSDAQAGFAILNLEDAAIGWIVEPIYRTIPQTGQAALFVFSLPLGRAIPQYIAVNSRTGSDYGLDFRFEGLNHAVPPIATYTEFWGVPGAEKNDLMRFQPHDDAMVCAGNPRAELFVGKVPVNCLVEHREPGAEPELTVHPKFPVDSSLAPTPFMQNPTTCTGPLTSSVDVLFYDLKTARAEAPWPATTGCEKLSFNPSLAAKPTTTEADSPTGLATDLKVPQFSDENTPSPSEIRGQTVELPPGFSLNSSAADGKTTCSDAQANLHNEAAAECPEFSKVGSTELQSSALPGPIYGYIYLGTPRPDDRWRVILTASGYGTNVKIVGSAHLNPVTGQVVTTFQDLPQTPFQEFNLHFFGSERGLFATPTQCGTYPVHSLFQPWAAELSDQTSTQFFDIGSGPGGTLCPNGARPFSPAIESGVEDNTAGKHSPLLLQIRRADGEETLAGATVQAPPGLSARLKGVPYCPQSAIAALQSGAVRGVAEQAAPACPAASQIGTAVAGAGAGTHQVYVRGGVYLAGPYKGAPLSLVASIPAVSGPYDLGVVAVRVALFVDPVTAEVTAVSDPLPQIQEGVPLRTRSILLRLNRPNFTLNPTNCEPFSVATTLTGYEGRTAHPSSPFQIANCTDLDFTPKMSLKLSGSSRRGAHPGLRAVLKSSSGDANLKRVVVTLPHSEFLDSTHLRAPCTMVQFEANACPDRSRIGMARAESPLLDKPLEGPVYLRSSKHRLPDILVDLHGQFHIELDGRVDSVKQRLRTTFTTLPDVPVSRFMLRLQGGGKGLLENSDGVCSRSHKASVKMNAQNGLSRRLHVRVKAPCGAARHHKGHKRPGNRGTRAGG
jgi:hypothetical protein